MEVRILSKVQLCHVYADANDGRLVSQKKNLVMLKQQCVWIAHLDTWRLPQEITNFLKCTYEILSSCLSVASHTEMANVDFAV